MQTHTIEVRTHAELEPPRADHEVAACGIGPAGERVDLWTDTAGADALWEMVTAPNGVRYPPCVLDRPVPCIATTSRGADVAEVPVDVRLSHPYVQPLPDGRLLVVGARCQYDGEHTIPNAAVYDDAGDPVTEGLLGDGIRHVLTTSRGDVWVGYFDEGVFGNFGWHGSVEPLGASGIVCYDGSFDRGWEFPGGGAAPYVTDCYALNVTDTAVWSCYYTDFPVVRVSGGAVSSWQNPDTGSGARAVLVDGTAVALVGGYRGERGRVVVGDLAGDAFRPHATRRLRLPGGEPLPPGTELVGRGDELHLLHGPRWWKLSLDQL